MRKWVPPPRTVTMTSPALRSTALAVSSLVSRATTSTLADAPMKGRAGTTTDLIIDLGERRLRVEVRDAAAGRPERRDPSFDDLSGRGLLIVDELADRWGVDEAPPGKSVWFELDAGGSSGSLATPNSA